MKTRYFAIAVLVVLMLAGCTINQRETMISFESGRDTQVEANGAQNTTSTDQKADGKADLSGLVEAVTQWVEKNMTGLVSKIKVSDLVDESKLAEPEALEDADQGTVEEVE